jgi:hypothetical protein
MMAWPIVTGTICEILNLPKDDFENNTIWAHHSPDVLRYMQAHTDAAVYALVAAEEATDEIQKAFGFSYANLMLRSTVEFINLNTVGRGIIKSTGMDNLSTNLLSGSELASMRESLELKALEAVSSSLNALGQMRLSTLQPKSERKFFRCGLI